MKPTITKEQAEAIEKGINVYEHQGLTRGPVLYSRLILDHSDVLDRKTGPWIAEFACLNDMILETLAAALVNGYEVEKAPEEKVREYYDKLWADYCDTNDIEIAKETIINTLDLLGIKIEGVNA
ncbi:hypothetical protein MOF07_19390 [Bacillus spizizenii]|nr:hypothetical protein [Bacillus spizizenii]